METNPCSDSSVSGLKRAWFRPRRYYGLVLMDRREKLTERLNTNSFFKTKLALATAAAAATLLGAPDAEAGRPVCKAYDIHNEGIAIKQGETIQVPLHRLCHDDDEADFERISCRAQYTPSDSSKTNPSLSLSQPCKNLTVPIKGPGRLQYWAVDTSGSSSPKQTVRFYDPEKKTDSGFPKRNPNARFMAFGAQASGQGERGLGSLDDVLGGEVPADEVSADAPAKPAAKPKPAAPAKPKQDSPTKPVRAGPEKNTPSTATFVAPWRLNLGTNIYGSSFSMPLNYAGFEIDTGKENYWTFGATALGGFTQQGSGEYDSINYNFGGTTMLRAPFGLSARLAGVYNNRESDALAPSDANANMVPNINQESRQFGAILGYQHQKVGDFRFVLGYTNDESTEDQTMTTQRNWQTDDNDIQIVPGGSIQTRTLIDWREVQRRWYDGSSNDEGIGFALGWLSPKIGGTGLRLGPEFGYQHRAFSSRQDNTLETRVTGDGTVTVDVDVNGTQDSDSQPVNIDETSRVSGGLMSPRVEITRHRPFFGTYIMYDLEGQPVFFDGRVRVFVDPLQEDESRLNYSAHLAMPNDVLVPHVFGMYADQTHTLSVGVFGGKSDDDAVRNFYRTKSDNRFDFQPRQMQLVDEQLALAGLYGGLMGPLVMYTIDAHTSDDHPVERVDHRFEAGWGFEPVAITGSFSGEVGRDIHGTQKFVNPGFDAGLTVKPEALGVGSLTVRGGRQGENDYNFGLVFTGNFGRGDE